jgi:hypothetical protein
LTMIANLPAHHNARRVLLITLLCSLFLLSACSGGSDTAQNSGPDQKKSAGCDAAINAQAWEGFLVLAERLNSGETIPAPEMESFLELPVMVLWKESITQGKVGNPQVGRWIEAAFWDKVGQGRPQKLNSDRRSFGMGYRFNFDHRQQIQEALAAYRAEQNQCRVLELARRWLDADKVPDPFVVNFVPGKAELRSFRGNLMADTSLLIAAETEQLTRQMVAMLYRDLQAMDGPSPIEETGASSVAHTWRTLMNEAVCNYIEDLPGTHFNEIHPKLAKVHVIPEQIFQTSVRSVELLNASLPELLADPQAMEERGFMVAESMAGMGAFTMGGFGLAEVIAARLGEDRLVSVRRDPIAFLEAYQEAALQNATPLPRPGTMGRELHESMPAFSDEVFTGLKKILSEEFGTS